MSRWKNTVRKASYLLAAGILFTTFPANGFFWIPGPYLPQKGFKYGAVYTRAIVYDDNGNPTWVSYGPDGKVSATYGPATGELAQARVMSASSVKQIVALLKAVKEEHHLDAGDVISRETYRGTGFTTFNDQPIAKPDISDTVAYVAVKPKAKRFRTDGGDLILLTLPIDPNIRVGNGTESLLISKDGGMLYESSGTIGYKTAFHEKDEEGGYRKHEAKIYGPIQGAYLSLSDSFIPGETLTDEEGKYSMSYYLPACPGYTFDYTTPLYLELAYRRFNPRGAHYLTYWISKPGYDFCNGLSVISWMLTGIIATQAEPAHFPTDFAVDILPIAGQAGFTVPVGGPTAYNKSQPAFTTLAQQQYDLDSDGQYDRAVLGKIVQEGNGEPVFIGTSPEEAEIQGVWLSSGDQSSPLPHLTRRPDLKADFGGRGLLSSLSTEDLRNTDLYLFRESDGTLLIERKGLDEKETSDVGTDIETGKFFYTLPLLNTRELTFSRMLWGKNEFARVQKEWYGFVDEKQYEREADHLRAGERVKIVIINRATGYMGTRSVMLRTSGVSDITLYVGDIFLQPPNLKIWARRKYNVEYGLTKGKQREYQIGNEGAALADDQQIEIRTEWLDESGLPLPEELGEHGFTGRIAKLVESSRLEAAGGSFSSCEPSCDGSSLSQFAIKPGRQLQVIRLPDKVVGKNHLYIHVNGEPKNRGTADFGDGNAIPGRPRLLVPVKVPVYDEGMTLEAIRTYNQAKKADPNANYEKPEPVYNFVYRPEFQFSVYDLEVEEIRRTDVEQHTENILTKEKPVVTSSDQLLEIYYSLTIPEATPLPGYSFQNEKELIFSVGAEEIEAKVNGEEPISFSNFNHLALLKPEDFLAISLYANNDTGNVLWEWAFAYLEGEPKNTNISADDPTVELVVFVPGEIEDTGAMIWQVEGSGSVSPPQSASDVGVFTTKLRTSTKAGSEVYVIGRMVNSEIPQAPDGAEIKLGPFKVLPGKPDRIELGSDSRTLPADTLSTVPLSATVYDAYNNKVSDETPVSWTLDYDGKLVDGRTHTVEGVAGITYNVGEETGASRVTIEAGTAKRTFEIAKQRLDATLSASQTVLPAGTQGTTTITLATDARDGTPVIWNTTRGELISAAGAVSGGHATAVLRAASAPGDGLVTASVANHTEHIQIVHAGGGALTATFEHAAIVGGDLSGTVSVEGLEGVESYQTMTGTSVTLQGTPGTRVTLGAGGFYTPNTPPTLHYAMNAVEEGFVYDEQSRTPAGIFGGVVFDVQESFTLPGTSLHFEGGHLLVDPIAALDAQEGLYANVRFRVSPDDPSGSEATLIRKSLSGGGLFGMGNEESWSLHLTDSQTVEARVTTNQGTFVATIPTTVVPGRWYIAGIRLGKGTLEVGLNGERAKTAVTGGLVGAGGAIEIGTGFSGHLDDVKIGVESQANALFTFSDGSLSREVVIGADGTARVAIQATTNDPSEQGQVIGLSAYEEIQTTEGPTLRERELIIGGLSGLLGIRTAYADETAAAQQAGIAIVRPVKWGAIAQWAGKKVFGQYFDEVKVIAEFVYQLTAVSDVVTLLKAVVSFAKDGDADNVDGFEVTFATIGIGVTVLSVASGAGAAALPQIRSGLVAVKPVLKELFSTGLPEALQTGKILGKYIFDRLAAFISNPRMAMSEVTEFTGALTETVTSGARGLTYVFKTVRSLHDLKRWLRLRRLKGICLVARGDAPLRYAAIGPEGQAWVLDTLAQSVSDALFGRLANAGEACQDVLAKLDEIEGVYGFDVHNAVAEAVDVLHSNNLAIWGRDSLDVLAKIADKDPALVQKFAENAKNKFATGKSFKLAADGPALDTLLGLISKIDPATPGYAKWVEKLGKNMFQVKAIAGEAQGVEAVMDAYKARGVKLEHLSDRVDVPYEKLDGEGIVIATRNKDGVDGVFKLNDGTPVFMEAKAISAGTKLADDEIYKRIVKQYEKHLITKVLPYVRREGDTYQFVVDGKVLAPVMHYHLVGGWFTPERVAKIHEKLDRVVADKFPQIKDASPAFSKNITVGTTIPTITN